LAKKRKKRRAPSPEQQQQMRHGAIKKFNALGRRGASQSTGPRIAPPSETSVLKPSSDSEGIES